MLKDHIDNLIRQAQYIQEQGLAKYRVGLKDEEHARKLQDDLYRQQRRTTPIDQHLEVPDGPFNITYSPPTTSCPCGDSGCEAPR